MIYTFLARLFSYVLFGALLLLNWKRPTVRANYDVACKWNPAVARTKFPLFYERMMCNLARHAGELLFCFPLFKRLPRELLAYPYSLGGIRFEIAPDSETILQEMRKGGIFLTAHYGNYEAMGPWLCCLGIPLAASYIPVKPGWLNKILENRIRAVGGKTYSVNAKSPREFLRLLQDGRLFCLLADQDSRIPSAQSGTFLGAPAHMNPLPDFLLKHRPETPLYICWIEEPDLRTKRFHAEKLRVGEGETVIEAFNRWLESRIAEEPALWYSFTHRRFYSTTPEIYSCAAPPPSHLSNL